MLEVEYRKQKRFFEDLHEGEVFEMTLPPFLPEDDFEETIFCMTVTQPFNGTPLVALNLKTGTFVNVSRNQEVTPLSAKLIVERAT